jgi:O-antigen/teichoic acid export membrane protein
MVMLYISNKMNRAVLRIKQDELVRSGGIFLIGALSVAVLNYLYQVFMGRMLGSMEYGILGSLFAIIYLTTFAGNTFSRVTAKYSAEFKGKKQDAALRYLIKRGLFKTAVYGLIALAIYLLLVPTMARFMNFNDYSGLIMVGVIGYISVLGAVITGALNGLQKFVWQNSISFVSAALKFGAAILLVYLGFGVNGALVAIIAGSVIILIVGFWPLKNELTKKITEKIKTKEIYLYAIPVLVASVLPLMAITFDQILVKHFFSSVDAGHYAAAGNIAKIIWFGSGFLVSALFPKIVSDKAQGKNVSSLLIRGLVYTSFFVLIGTGILFATPRLIVSVMYGVEYLDIVSYVGLFGLALGLFSINQVLITYNLAVEKYGFLWIALAGFLLEIVGIGIFHSLLSDVIKIVLLSQAFTMIGMLLYNRKELFNGNGYK